MKLRTDFVTNSSSSSFIYIDIKSEKLKAIMEKYSDLLEELKDYICCGEMEAGDGFKCSEDECGYCDVPTDENDIMETLITFFEEFAEYCDEFEERIPELVQELRDNQDEITADITETEWVCGDVGWGGDSDSRYDPDNYDEDTLQSIYEEIIEKNGYANVDDVTEEDFCEHVGCQTSNEENRYTFNRKDGISEHHHSFELL